MAVRYWVGGGSSSNWNATGNTNWSDTSGGANNFSVPTSVDDVYFDGAGTNGNTNSIISANITVKSLTISTGYTATMTHNAQLSIAGSWTMSNTHTIAGTATLVITAAGTITTNSQTWPNSLYIAAAATLADDLTISQTLQINGGGFNGSARIVNVANGLTMITNGGTGSAKINLTGGTWSGTPQIGHNLDLNGNITISGSVSYGISTYYTLKYVSGTITTTGSTLNFTGNCYINTSGITWNNVVFASFSEFVLQSNFVATGTTSCIDNRVLLNGSYTYSTNGITVSLGSQNVSGAAKIILTGGTWSHTTTRTIANSLDIAGNVTISGNVYYGGGTLTYVSGTVTTTGSTLNLSGSSTLNTGSLVFNSTIINGFFTYTLSGNFETNSLTVQTSTVSVNKTTAETLTVNNGITVSSQIAGSTKIILKGGTWSGAGRIDTNLDLQGNSTISGNVYYGTGTLKYVSGTITTTSSTLNLAASCTLDTTGTIWNNLTTANSLLTITINSNLVVNNTLTVGTAGVTFAGTTGWTCTNFLNQSISAATISLKDGNTYTVNSSFSCFTSRVGSILLFTSSSATLKANLILVNGASCACLASFTRINALTGRTINAFGGTITNCDNIRQFYDLSTVTSIS